MEGKVGMAVMCDQYVRHSYGFLIDAAAASRVLSSY